jgi:hypothetical protein
MKDDVIRRRIGKWKEKAQERNTWWLIGKEAKSTRGRRAEKEEKDMSGQCRSWTIVHMNSRSYLFALEVSAL